MNHVHISSVIPVSNMKYHVLVTLRRITICNCTFRKRRGHQPTGILITTAKATGFSSVSEMLHKSADRTNNEKDCADMTADHEKVGTLLSHIMHPALLWLLVR